MTTRTRLAELLTKARGAVNSVATLLGMGDSPLDIKASYWEELLADIDAALADVPSPSAGPEEAPTDPLDCQEFYEAARDQANVCRAYDNLRATALRLARSLASPRGGEPTIVQVLRERLIATFPGVGSPPSPEEVCFNCKRVPDHALSSANPRLTICRACWMARSAAPPREPSEAAINAADEVGNDGLVGYAHMSHATDLQVRVLALLQEAWEKHLVTCPTANGQGMGCSFLPVVAAAWEASIDNEYDAKADQALAAFARVLREGL